jgi:hypothetical protein
MAEVDDAFIERGREWPPREGWTFFFLWVGGSIVSSVISQILWSVVAFSQRTYGASSQRWLNVLPGVALAGWHAWLLFSRREKLRWTGWMALPVLYAVLPYAFANSSGTAFPKAAGVVTILTTSIAAALLKGVRIKPWLWLFINLGGLVVYEVTVTQFYSFGFGFQTLDQFAGQLNAFFRIPSALSLTGSALFSSLMSGLSLAVTILAAWALAWWMPPIRREESTVNAA